MNNKDRIHKGRVDWGRCTDKLPPHSIEAEQGVLGCMLLGREAIGIAMAKLHAGSEVFYDLRHRALYELLLEMFDANEPIDIISINVKLKDRGAVESAGGLAYISSLPDATPSESNIEHYIGIVLEKYTQRKLVWTCTDIIARSYEHAGTSEELLEQVEQDIFGLRNVPRGTNRRESFLSIIDMMEQGDKGVEIGVPTGFYDIDRVLHNLKPGQMVTIAARPGVGKTSFAFNMAENLAVRRTISVGFFTLEMSQDELNLRSVGSFTGIDMKMALRGGLDDKQKQTIVQTVGFLNKAPLYIHDRHDLRINQLRAEARRMVKDQKVRLIIIDYLQLVSGCRKFENRTQEVGEVSRGIKSMAMELGIPVVALAQLNREFDKETKRKPRLSDLRESGSIEQDSDIVAFLYCADETKLADEIVPIKFLIAKHRNGPTAEIDLLFRKQITKFENAA